MTYQELLNKIKQHLSLQEEIHNFLLDGVEEYCQITEEYYNKNTHEYTVKDIILDKQPEVAIQVEDVKYNEFDSLFIDLRFYFDEGFREELKNKRKLELEKEILNKKNVIQSEIKQLEHRISNLKKQEEIYK